MPSFSVDPGDLAVVGAGTSDEADALTAAAALVVAAGRAGTESLGPASAAVVVALDDYVHGDGVVAATLGVATRTLGEGLSQAAGHYRQAELDVGESIGAGAWR